MRIYHIVWVTHNSRVSERMIKYHVKRGEPLLLNSDEEVEITQFIRDIVVENGYVLLAYNICSDHVHLILVCEDDKRNAIVGHLKGKTVHLYKQAHGIETTFHLWAQKYGHREIRDDKQLYNTIEYIRYNRRKHSLPTNRRLRPIVLQMLADKQGVTTPCWVLGLGSKHMQESEKKETVILTKENEMELKFVLADIEQINRSAEIPPRISKRFCRKCAYYEFCWV